jgi:hypothetical protein
MLERVAETGVVVLGEVPDVLGVLGLVVAEAGIDFANEALVGPV